MNLQEMRLDGARKQQKGIHFILASVIIWTIVMMIHLSPLPILTKNLFTFCATAPLMPIAYMISKILKIDFTNKENPLTNLGVLFSINQMLYLLIAMWIYSAVPDKMVMVLAMIFGAHLLPYGWLYQSRSYLVLSVVIPIAALLIGLFYPAAYVAAFMLVVEIGFSILLRVEVRNLPAAA